jgi:hypothetical protein
MLSIDCGIAEKAVETGLFIMAVAVHCKAVVKLEEIEHARSTIYVVTEV